MITFVKKEGVSRTYDGVDGYAPTATYLGREGYCLAFELRKGKQHCQKDTPELLRAACPIESARTDSKTFNRRCWRIGRLALSKPRRI